MTKVKISAIGILTAFLILISSNLSPALALYTNMPANVVVGQSNFTDNTLNAGLGSTNPRGIKYSYATIVIGGKLLIADYTNNRILVWNSIPTTNGVNADVVIGQSNFTGNSANQGGSAAANTLQNPWGMGTDGTRLFVADYFNCRVLVYNRVPTSNNASADIVIGQTTMSGTTCAQTSTNYSGPSGVVYDAKTGKLFVSDYDGKRILIYNSVPTTNGAAADVVVGQTDFTSSAFAATATNLNDPSGLLIADSKLVISDTLNNRIMIYNSIPTTNGAAANVVIGQPDFTSSTFNQGLGTNVNSQTIDLPSGVAWDGKRLYVADESNDRLLVYNGVPTANNASADLVIGQPSFTVKNANQGGNPAANTLNVFESAYFYNNQLFVLDSLNFRLLIYNNIISTPQLSISSPAPVTPGQLRIRGNVLLGNNGTYALQSVKADINGQGLGNVTILNGGKDEGSNTRYEFTEKFNPTINGGDANNYTVRFVASSFNVDSSSLFYFMPFNFNYVTQSKGMLNFDFKVTSKQAQRVIDNVDHFAIFTQKVSNSTAANPWVQLGANIATGQVDKNTGEVYVKLTNTLLPLTKYNVKIEAFSKDSNWSQDSNILSYLVPKKK